MDRRVKERLVGASLLAVLVVLVVPELLSGPAPKTPPAAPANATDATRNVTVDLATRKPTTEAAPSAGEPAAPAASAASPEDHSRESTPRAAPSVVTMPPAVPPAAPALERPTPSPTSPAAVGKTAGHGWAVQLGVFASRSNADKLAHELKTQGFPAYVLSGGTGTAARYRVRVGPMADRAAAAQALARIKSLGHSGSLAAPGT